ncbi:putative fibronectin type III domain containing protein 3C1-like [Penaeus vannamei]|uniref:Putative fibronectin type III domain containing protein 3C1-like n=1 Tax=Penaeus vannamei TaxID=6689 RepID=A0A3R7PU24_PENVA|nr:putative fibronectin type III domain containing protein 3C1-like [Penaeus vannamei]
MDNTKKVTHNTGGTDYWYTIGHCHEWYTIGHEWYTIGHWHKWYTIGHWHEWYTIGHCHEWYTIGHCHEWYTIGHCHEWYTIGHWHKWYTIGHCHEWYTIGHCHEWYTIGHCHEWYTIGHWHVPLSVTGTSGTVSVTATSGTLSVTATSGTLSVTDTSGTLSVTARVVHYRSLARVVHGHCHEWSVTGTSGTLTRVYTIGHWHEWYTIGGTLVTGTHYRSLTLSVTATSGTLSVTATSGTLSVTATSGTLSVTATSGTLSVTATSGTLSVTATIGNTVGHSYDRTGEGIHGTDNVRRAEKASWVVRYRFHVPTPALWACPYSVFATRVPYTPTHPGPLCRCSLAVMVGAQGPEEYESRECGIVLYNYTREQVSSSSWFGSQGSKTFSLSYYLQGDMPTLPSGHHSLIQYCLTLGCSSIIVKESLVPVSLKRGKVVALYLGERREFPTARCHIRSKFLSGWFTVVVAPIKFSDVGMVPGVQVSGVNIQC